MRKVTKNLKSRPPLGRPRAFNPDTALDRALLVFWRKGYEGASLADLTRAMRINRPSMYAAFGNKEALFLKALDRYTEGPVSFMRDAMAEPTARSVAERVFRAAAELMTDKRHPSGCLMVQGALACGESAEPIRRELISRRAAGECDLRKRFERAKLEGDLPADSDPADLARYVMTVLHGMSVEAAGGANRDELQRVAALALRNWPS